MILLNFILFPIIIALLLLRKSYFTAVLYSLVIFFHLLPLMAIESADINLETDAFQNLKILNLSIIFWSLPFLITSLVFKFRSDTKEFYRPINSELILKFVVIVFSLIMLFNNIYSLFILKNFGYLAVYSSSKDFLIKNTTILPIYIYCANILLVNQFKNNPTTRSSISFKIAILMYCLTMSSYLLFGGRSSFLYFIIVTFLILISRIKINLTKVFIFGAFLLYLMVFVGFQRDGLSNKDIELNYFQRIIFELSHTVIVFNNSIEILEINLYRYWDLLYTGLPNFITALVNVKLPLSLSQTYVNTLDPNLSDLGGGFGFSILAEFYLIGGFLGVIFGSFLFSILALKIDSVFAGNRSKEIGFFSVVSYFLLMTPRGELGDLYRPIIITSIVFFLSRIKYSIK